MTNEMMNAALFQKGEADLVVASIPVPEIQPNEVLVKVEACNVVQNLRNVLKAIGTGALASYPQLPAVLGLDVSGTIERCGSLTSVMKEGDRVYVNPGLSCGGCTSCRSGDELDCDYYALRGYFGIGSKSQSLLNLYPQGGFAQFIAVPQASIVRIPDNLDFNTASRFGHLGTAFRALKQANCSPGKTVLINGISGTLGLGAAALALALGAKRVLGTARNTEFFPKVIALGDPGRVSILESGTEKTEEWVKRNNEGEGADIVIDALSGGTPPEPFQQAFYSLRRGGSLINIGAVTGDIPLNLMWLMNNNIKLIGSCWFTRTDAQEMADLVRQGLLDLSFFENKTYSLEEINVAIQGTVSRNGGFTNYVINPNQGYSVT